MEKHTSEPAPQTTDFLWGVATSAYQSEGGYNGKGQPQTNWAAAEVLGDVQRAGLAVDFWNRYAEDFETCRAMGLNAFRLSVEWSRIQPVFVNYRGSPPEFDLAALDHYADMLAACRRAGLDPVLTLHHFVHPAWLGVDAWLKEDTPARFAAYVRETVLHLNRRLVDVHRLPPVRTYITINEPNTLLLSTYIIRQFPTRTFGGVTKLLKATNHLLAAHVKAYNVIHDVHAEQGWAEPRVTLNNFCTDLYWSDKVFLDLLAFRERGVDPSALPAHLLAKAAEFERALAAARIPLKTGLPQRIGERLRRLMHRRGQTYFRREHLQGLIREVAESPRKRLLDFIAIDYYDPFTAHLFRMPSFADIELRNKSFRTRVMHSVTSKWWDWHVLPVGLHFFCRYYSEDFDGRPILIAENGMALRRKKNNSNSPRRDRVSRSEFLRAHVGELQRIRKDGVPLIGYFHWSLFDNYEWGTYTPRFGLFSIDYTRGTDRLAGDLLGDRPSETYAQLIRDARGP